MQEPDNILTVKELAQYLKLAESTIYKLAQDGEIPGRKIGGTWRFYRDSINEWMGGKASPPDSPEGEADQLNA